MTSRAPGLQIFFPLRHWRQAFKAIIDTTASDVNETSTLQPQQLIQVALPRLRGLSATDVACARDDDVFEQMRAGLARSLESIEAAGYAESAIRSAQLLTAELSTAARRALNKSRFWRSTMSGMAQFRVDAVRASGGHGTDAGASPSSGSRVALHVQRYARRHAHVGSRPGGNLAVFLADGSRAHSSKMAVLTEQSTSPRPSPPN